MLQGIGYQSDMYSAYNRIQQRRVFEEDSLNRLSGQNQNPATQEAAASTESVQEMDLRLDSIKPRQNISLEDISLSLKENAPFEMKGRDSDISSLDMEKALSDMQKDQALMQYQYFVGDTNELMNNEDGIVIAK